MSNPLSGNTGYFFGMTYARYEDLQWGTGPAQLTEDEMKMGWHWCLEWDDMLIHPAMAEYAHCSCAGCEEHAAKAFEREKALAKLQELCDLQLEANENNDKFRNNKLDS